MWNVHKTDSAWENLHALFTSFIYHTTSYDNIEWYTMEFPTSHLYFPDIDKRLLAILKLQNWFRAPKALIMRMRLAISWEPCVVMTR